MTPILDRTWAARPMNLNRRRCPSCGETRSLRHFAGDLVGVCDLCAIEAKASAREVGVASEGSGGSLPCYGLAEVPAGGKTLSL